MFALIFYFAFAVLPRPAITEDRVELVELNTYYDDHGKLLFSQLIFYNWDKENSRYEIIDWRFYRAEATLFSFRGTGSLVILYDDDRLRKIQCKFFRDTHTQYDPETLDREILPKEKRKKLNSVP